MSSSGPDAVGALLDAHHVLHLATAGPEGPHSAPLFFAHIDMDLTWLSAPHVGHSQHVEASGLAAGSVGPSAPSLGLIEGVQLRGTAARAEDPSPWRDAWLRRFPMAAPMLLSARDHHFYVFRPRWLRLVRTVAGVSQNRVWTRDADGWRVEPAPA